MVGLLGMEESFFQGNKRVAPNVCEIVGVTSAVGGCGVTSTALALCRIYASLFEYKTLYLSLDYLSSKARPKEPLLESGARVRCRDAVYGIVYENQIASGKLVRDEFGVCYFPPDDFKNSLHFLAEEQLGKLIKTLEADFDRIVFDIPINCFLSGYTLEICDSIVVCNGWQPERMKYGEELFEGLKQERDGVFGFASAAGEGVSDIYGSFGSEVRSLAETIEGR